MTSPDLSDDDVVLALLSEAIDTADPVPDEAVAAAKAVAGLNDADAELATLLADSLVDERPLVFRHDVMTEPDEACDRLVTFATPELNVDIDLNADGRTLIGVVTPAASVPIDVETPRGIVTTTSDELGRFQLAAGPGLCRLRIHAGDGVVVTPWITR